MPNPFGPLGDIFLWSLLELNQNLWFFRPANTDRPFASSILNTNAPNQLCDRSAFYIGGVMTIFYSSLLTSHNLFITPAKQKLLKPKCLVCCLIIFIY